MCVAFVCSFWKWCCCNFKLRWWLCLFHCLHFSMLSFMYDLFFHHYLFYLIFKNVVYGSLCSKGKRKTRFGNKWKRENVIMAYFSYLCVCFNVVERAEKREKERMGMVSVDVFIIRANFNLNSHTHRPQNSDFTDSIDLLSAS